MTEKNLFGTFFFTFGFLLALLSKWAAHYSFVQWTKRFPRQFSENVYLIIYLFTGFFFLIAGLVLLFDKN